MRDEGYGVFSGCGAGCPHPALCAGVGGGGCSAKELSVPGERERGAGLRTSDASLHFFHACPRLSTPRRTPPHNTRARPHPSPAMADLTLRDLLVDTKVSALIRKTDPHALAVLAPDSSVEHALATLAGHKVLSAPIVGKVRGRRRERERERFRRAERRETAFGPRARRLSQPAPLMLLPSADADAPPPPPLL